MDGLDGGGSEEDRHSRCPDDRRSLQRQRPRNTGRMPDTTPASSRYRTLTKNKPFVQWPREQSRWR